MSAATISLEFGVAVDEVVRARINYAFRVFAAIYGYRTVEDSDEQADFLCSYGGTREGVSQGNRLHISARYKARKKEESLPTFEKVRYANQNIYLVHGVNGTSGEPDWLGELFEWLSGSLELPIVKRDDVGRIPYSEMVFSRQGISPLQPHAAILMAWLENALQNGGNCEALPKANSPVGSTEHMVICSHDIDFYFTGIASALARSFKNVGISAFLYKSPSFFASNIRMIAETLAGKHVGEYIPEMLDAIEAAGFHSTLFAVAGGRHRRDPDYKVENIAGQLSEAVKRGFSVGVHGSYESVEGGSLPQEVNRLEACIGEQMKGNRQHWLRFDEHAKLYASIEDAGMVYDSSLGFSETCGFRNGASFAFPPYDFTKEKACEFLEIPLVMMDGSLELASKKEKKNPQELAIEILEESRKWGWGGISILWHNPMEAIQVTKEVNQVFWSCARRRKVFGEEWMSADEFMKKSLSRYQNAGLLQKVRLNG